MLLWTIMPEETVLEGIDQLPRCQYKHYMGKDVMVEPRENGKGIIVQLLSTDPNDFMNQLFSPGKEITPQ